jgi:hypothetical protein
MGYTRRPEASAFCSETEKISMTFKIPHGFLLRIIPECSIFTPQMALAVGAKWFHKILHLILCLLFMNSVCWLGLLHKIFTALFVLVSGLYMLYGKINCIFSCYLHTTNLGHYYATTSR